MLLVHKRQDEISQLNCQWSLFGVKNLCMAHMTLAHAQMNYHVLHFGQWNWKMLTYCIIGTPMTFHWDLSSIIAICSSCPQMKYQVLEFVHLNLNPVCELAVDVICCCKSLRDLQALISWSLTDWSVHPVDKTICICKTVVANKQASYVYYLLVMCLAAFVILRWWYQLSPLALKMLSVQTRVQTDWCEA